MLLQSYPALRIEAYAGDYFDGLDALSEAKRGRTLALFLGSNIGNFDDEEAHTFLRHLRRVLRAGDALLLGADLRKSPAILEAAASRGARSSRGCSALAGRCGSGLRRR